MIEMSLYKQRDSARILLPRVQQNMCSFHLYYAMFQRQQAHAESHFPDKYFSASEQRNNACHLKECYSSNQSLSLSSYFCIHFRVSNNNNNNSNKGMYCMSLLSVTMNGRVTGKHINISQPSYASHFPITNRLLGMSGTHVENPVYIDVCVCFQMKDAIVVHMCIYKHLHMLMSE